MRKKSEYRIERRLIRAISEVYMAELSCVSDHLYFSIFCEEDYPELSELFERFGREHADNIKKIKLMQEEIGIKCGCHTKAAELAYSEGGVCDIVYALEEKEREVKLLYERIYMLCDHRRFEEEVKEILRASEMRLSILENIQKS